jgi:hypothetical protein
MEEGREGGRKGHCLQFQNCLGSFYTIVHSTSLSCVSLTLPFYSTFVLFSPLLSLPSRPLRPLFLNSSLFTDGTADTLPYDTACACMGTVEETTIEQFIKRHNFPFCIKWRKICVGPGPKCHVFFMPFSYELHDKDFFFFYLVFQIPSVKMRVK